MKDINLIAQQEIKRIAIYDNKKLIIILMTVLTILLITGASILCLDFLNKKCEEKQISVNEATEKYKVVEDTRKNIDIYNEKINNMSEVLESISNNSIINTSLFEEISMVMPDNMFLLNYSVSKAGELNFVGKSKDNESMAYFIHKLDETKMFSDIKIKSINNNINETSTSDNSINMEDTKNAPEYSFVITVKLKE